MANFNTLSTAAKFGDVFGKLGHFNTAISALQFGAGLIDTFINADSPEDAFLSLLGLGGANETTLDDIQHDIRQGFADLEDRLDTQALSDAQQITNHVRHQLSAYGEDSDFVDTTALINDSRMALSRVLDVAKMQLSTADSGGDYLALVTAVNQALVARMAVVATFEDNGYARDTIKAEFQNAAAFLEQAQAQYQTERAQLIEELGAGIEVKKVVSHYSYEADDDGEYVGYYYTPYGGDRKYKIVHEDHTTYDERYEVDRYSLVEHIKGYDFVLKTGVAADGSGGSIYRGDSLVDYLHRAIAGVDDANGSASFSPMVHSYYKFFFGMKDVVFVDADAQPQLFVPGGYLDAAQMQALGVTVEHSGGKSFVRLDLMNADHRDVFAEYLEQAVLFEYLDDQGFADDGAFIGELTDAFEGLFDGRAFIGKDGHSDHFTGTDGNDFLNGKGGDDELYGGAGADGLKGGTGQDVMDGGEGADLLVGGRTTDRTDPLLWDNARDTFVFADPDMPDRIKEFETHNKVYVKTGEKVWVQATGQYEEVSDEYVINGDVIHIDQSAFISHAFHTSQDGRFAGWAGYVANLKDDQMTAHDDYDAVAGTLRLTQDQFAIVGSGQGVTAQTRVYQDGQDLYYDYDGSGTNFDAIHFATLQEDIKLDHDDFYFI